MAVVKQAAFCGARVRISQHIRQTCWQAHAFQRGGEIGFIQVLIDDLFPALFCQFGG